jgi:hypothetical protein
MTVPQNNGVVNQSPTFNVGVFVDLNKGKKNPQAQAPGDLGSPFVTKDTRRRI